jgi:hypothetical protein
MRVHALSVITYKTNVTVTLRENKGMAMEALHDVCEKDINQYNAAVSEPTITSDQL